MYIMLFVFSIQLTVLHELSLKQDRYSRLDTPGEDEITTSGLPDWVNADIPYDIIIHVDKIKPDGKVYLVIDNVIQEDTVTESELNRDGKTYSLTGILYLFMFDVSKTKSSVKYLVRDEGGDVILTGDYKDVDIKCKYHNNYRIAQRESR